LREFKRRGMEEEESRTKAPLDKSPDKSPSGQNHPGQKSLLFSVGQNPSGQKSPEKKCYKSLSVN